MSKITQKNKRNLRKSNKKSLRRSNKKSLRRMKGGAEVAVGNERLDKFINGKSKETVNNLRKFWNKNFMETVPKNSFSQPFTSQMTTDGEKVLDKLNDETKRIHEEIKDSFESALTDGLIHINIMTK